MPTTLPDAADVIVLPPVEGLATLSDSELLARQREAATARQHVDARLASIAGELRRRSDRALGHHGLAARLGAASPEKAVQRLTGVSFSEAKALTLVGTAPDSPWLAPVTDAVASGHLSIAAAAAITAGLGLPSAAVASDDLMDAAAHLVDLAQHSTPELTAKAARIARDELDIEGVVDREAHRRSRRSLKWFEQADGMTRLIAVLDPESAAIVTGALDSILAPRRGGPRFVDANDRERARSLTDDPRTNEQLGVDALVDIVRLATRASGSTSDLAHLFGHRSPAVRVHVDLTSLEKGEGIAHLEGQSAAVSARTAQRYRCETGSIPILFDGSRAIDVGRTQRLHSARQRLAIAAQWNGCPWGDCDRPPAMTEVHHIEAFDGNNTTVANGISLCQFHHVELHTNKWSISTRGDGTYWLIPPAELDPHRTPMQLHSRSPLRAQGGSSSSRPPGGPTPPCG